MTDTLKARREQERADYTEALRAILDDAPRDRNGRPTLVVQVVSVSRSGMSRRMRVFYVDQERQLIEITGTVGRACELGRNDDGLRIVGCGMDMRFHLVDVIAWRCGIGNGNDIAVRAI